MTGQLSLIAIGILGVFAASTVILAQPISSTVEDFLDVINADVNVKPNDRLDARVETAGDIPEDGSGGAFGYGILTDDGDAVIAATTHGGVLDSEEQDDASDPIWHNHLVVLETGTDECGDDFKVDQITFESPGSVNIAPSDRALLRNVPTDEFEATNVDVPGTEDTPIELGGDITLTAGTDVQDVVSFVLEPISDDGDIEAICVTDVESADNVEVMQPSN